MLLLYSFSHQSGRLMEQVYNIWTENLHHPLVDYCDCKDRSFVLHFHDGKKVFVRLLI